MRKVKLVITGEPYDHGDGGYWYVRVMDPGQLVPEGWEEIEAVPPEKPERCNFYHCFGLEASPTRCERDESHEGPHRVEWT